MARLDIDMEARAAYLELSDSSVHETRQVASAVYVDLDEFGMVRGVEVLDLDADIPRQDLEKRFHVRAEDLARLEAIRPKVTFFMQRGTGASMGQDVFAPRSAAKILLRA